MIVIFSLRKRIQYEKFSLKLSIHPIHWFSTGWKRYNLLKSVNNSKLSNSLEFQILISSFKEFSR